MFILSGLYEANFRVARDKAKRDPPRGARDDVFLFLADIAVGISASLRSGMTIIFCGLPDTEKRECGNGKRLSQ